VSAPLRPPPAPVGRSRAGVSDAPTAPAVPASAPNRSGGPPPSPSGRPAGALCGALGGWERPAPTGPPEAPQRASGGLQGSIPLRLDAPTLAEAFGIPLSPRPCGIPAHLARLLPLLAENLTQDQIAARLGLSSEGVRSRLRRLYPLLGVHSRLGAVRAALGLGLLAPRGGSR